MTRLASGFGPAARWGDRRGGAVRHRMPAVLVLLALVLPLRSDLAAGASTAGVVSHRDSVPEPLRGKGRWGAVGDGEAPFPVRLDDEAIHFAVTFHTLLPGETVTVEAPADTEPRADGGRLVARAPGRWVWIAPDVPGIRWLRIHDAGGASVDVALLVLHPARGTAGEVLNGYRIGTYRSTPLRGDPAYLPPGGFVEVRPEDEDIRISPHFTLGEFLCKQPGDPRYLALSRPLVEKLELLLAAANAAGVSASGLTVMSGFRTPFYNRSIGNTTDYSRHLWGDAADVFIDEDGDGEMDDLNGDGARNIADARVLARVVEGLSAQAPEGYEPGGLAVYRRNPVHGPFVHVDARGVRARW